MAALQIYKRGQGRYVRTGTALALGMVVALGIFWLLGQQPLSTLPPQYKWVKAVVILILGAAGAVGALLAVNRPRTAEFMILTESEMRKVHWPSKQEVITSTKIVIMLTLLFAFMLFAVDFSFIKIFTWMGILPKGVI